MGRRFSSQLQVVVAGFLVSFLGGMASSGWDLRSYCARPVMVGTSRCSVDMVAWGVEFHGGGDGGPSWIKLMYIVSMVPAGRSAAVVSPGWLCLSREVVHPFGWICARSGFLDACGADDKLPGRCCAAFL